MGDTKLGGASVLASRLVGSLAPPESRDARDRAIRHRRRTLAAGSRRPHPPSRVRTGLEGLGCGVDVVKRKTSNAQHRKIGRASCRERVKITVGVGLLEKKDKVE